MGSKEKVKRQSQRQSRIPLENAFQECLVYRPATSPSLIPDLRDPAKTLKTRVSSAPEHPSSACQDKRGNVRPAIHRLLMFCSMKQLEWRLAFGAHLASDPRARVTFTQLDYQPSLAASLSCVFIHHRDHTDCWLDLEGRLRKSDICLALFGRSVVR
ncbi:hypothetical protein B0T26DRAFT_281898 [Lasiosphaeria miniovina]|uniref:Uncharacterized protein n=1 Tax=Lasiosphaeria miniovina TaxID=1954250 RepID=A0AA40DUR3_9PEZI|nr:uncharacterized protein B0T26DRAFT_281898 [Lasiosphaeria miniovina]KAK0717124.1 hypothetical protein B0T26DRAFT_281898 [Lasiosphaeria miniovina]